jgi:hypothetical protein
VWVLASSLSTYRVKVSGVLCSLCLGGVYQFGGSRSFFEFSMLTVRERLVVGPPALWSATMDAHMLAVLI